MEALFDTCKLLIADITRSCLASEVYQEELLKMAKYVAKCALVLSEIELHMRTEESLRGSKCLFVTVDGMVAALKQVQQLVEQYRSAAGGGVWPLEDAVEFQAAALEVQNAMIGLQKNSVLLPLDVQQDLQHFVRQLGELQFTMSELADTEVLVESTHQHTPRAREAVEQPSSPFDKKPTSPFHGKPPTAAHFPAPIRVPPAPAMSPSMDRDIVYTNMDTGVTALPPACMTKGVVGGEQDEELEQPPSPLPDDPFNMDNRLLSSTVRELEGLKLKSVEDARGSSHLAEEALLEAEEDNEDGKERVEVSEADALEGLRVLTEAGQGSEGEEEEEEGEASAEEEELGAALVEEVVALVDGDEEAEEGKREGQGEGEGEVQQVEEAEESWRGGGGGGGGGEVPGEAPVEVRAAAEEAVGSGTTGAAVQEPPAAEEPPAIEQPPEAAAGKVSIGDILLGEGVGLTARAPPTNGHSPPPPEAASQEELNEVAKGAPPAPEVGLLAQEEQ